MWNLFRFSILKFAFFIGITSKLSVARELKCSFGVGYLGKNCVLRNKEPILPDTNAETYEFTGLSENEKVQINSVMFKTGNVSFIPSETFVTFPQLDTISFEETNMTVLSFNWLDGITRNMSGNVKTLYLGGNGISQIDPRVISVFKKFHTIFLSKNKCVDYRFSKANGDFDKFEEKLRDCFNNFMKGYSLETIDHLKSSQETSNKVLSEVSKTTENLDKRIENFEVEFEKSIESIGGLFKDVEALKNQCENSTVELQPASIIEVEDEPVDSTKRLENEIDKIKLSMEALKEQFENFKLIQELWKYFLLALCLTFSVIVLIVFAGFCLLQKLSNIEIKKC